MDPLVNGSQLVYYMLTMCVYVCVPGCPTWDLENKTSYYHASFASIKSFCPASCRNCLMSSLLERKVNAPFAFLCGFVLIHALCAYVCVSPVISWGWNTVSPHSFTSLKSFAWQVAQTAWRVPYSNIKWWTCHLPFSVVSTCNIQNHAQWLQYRIQCY